MFMGKARSLPYSGVSEWCFIHSFRLQPYLQTLDYARKACQGQTLYLITKICKLRTKKFYNIAHTVKSVWFTLGVLG